MSKSTRSGIVDDDPFSDRISSSRPNTAPPPKPRGMVIKSDSKPTTPTVDMLMGTTGMIALMCDGVIQSCPIYLVSS